MSSKKDIARAAVIVTGAAILSKVLGFFREIVIASKFGTSSSTDAFIIALTAPEFFMDILAGGALTAAFIPVFSKYLAANDNENATRLFSTVFNILLALLGAVTVICMFNLRTILAFIAPGFSGDTLNLAAKVSSIIFPAMLFMGMASYLEGVLNASKHFLLPSLKQSILNIAIIVSALSLTSRLGVRSLAVGFLAGGILQFVILIYPVLKRKFGYILTIDSAHPGLREIGKLWIPLIAALVLSNLIGIVVKMLATTLPSGSVSALYFAYRLKQLPVVIFGVTLATAIFPFISWQVAENNFEEFTRSINRALKVIFFITVPICMLMAFFRLPIVAIMFERGSFTRNSTVMTAEALLYYLPGALAVTLNYVVIRAFYALKDPLTPLKATFIGLAVMVVSGLLLKDIYLHSGLALAHSLADSATFGFLFLYLALKLGRIQIVPLLGSFIKIMVISFVAVYPASALFHLLTEGVLSFSLGRQLLYFIPAAALAVILYTVLVLMFKVEEGQFFIRLIRERIR